MSVQILALLMLLASAFTALVLLLHIFMQYDSILPSHFDGNRLHYLPKVPGPQKLILN